PRTRRSRRCASRRGRSGSSRRRPRRRRASPRPSPCTARSARSSSRRTRSAAGTSRAFRRPAPGPPAAARPTRSRSGTRATVPSGNGCSRRSPGRSRCPWTPRTRSRRSGSCARSGARRRPARSSVRPTCDPDRAPRRDPSDPGGRVTSPTAVPRPTGAPAQARPRLHRDTHPASWPAPVRPTQVGIVHLGIGAFHRAHQAVVTEDAARATGDVRWGILGVTQRSAAVRDQLRPQGGVYAVLTVGPDGASPRVVGSVTDVAWPAEETPRVLAALAAPTTHVVSLTVTEKGYARRADGHLDTGSVRADLDALAAEEAAGPPPAAPGPRVAPATSAVGLLVRG